MKLPRELQKSQKHHHRIMKNKILDMIKKVVYLKERYVSP